MKTSEKIDKLAPAFVKAQSAIRSALKDKANPFFKSSYADLGSVWDACREALHTNGLAVVQTTDAGDGSMVTVNTTLLHDSGQWLMGSLSSRPIKADPQGIGSCITYARRYALSALVGVVSEEDDDGNAASGRASNPPPAQRETPSKPAAKKAGPKTELMSLVVKWGQMKPEQSPAACKAVFKAMGETADENGQFTDAQAVKALVWCKSAMEMGQDFGEKIATGGAA